MKRMLHPHPGVATLLLVALLLPVTAGAQDQEVKQKSTITIAIDGETTTIEVDGDEVLVNGERVAPDEDGRIVINTADGNERILRKLERGGHAFWVFDDGDASWNLNEGANPSVWFFGDDDGEFSVRSGHPRMLQFGENGEALRLYEEALRLNADRLREHEGLARLEVERLHDQLGKARVMAFGDGDAAVSFFGDGEDFEAQREIMRMERESRSLALKLRRTDDADERRDVEAELDDLLDQIFDRKMEARQARIDDLRERLQRLEESFGEREQERGRIIERRKRELLGEADKLDW